MSILMDNVSEQHLVNGHPMLVIATRNANAKLIADKKFGFRVAECGRSWELQAADYAKGRTQPGPKVTDAAPGFSWHQFNMAVDCYPFLIGDEGNLDWKASDIQFQEMVEYMKAEGLVWGGNWVNIKDYPHFQLANIPTTPTAADRYAYSLGGIEAVWKRYR